MPKMHICLVNPQNEFYSPISGGAIATINMQYAREFIRRGHRVSVLSPMNADPQYPIGEVVPLDSPQRHELNLVQRVWSRCLTRFHHWDMAYYKWYQKSLLRQLRCLSGPPDAVLLHNDLVSPKYVKKAIPTARVVVDLQNEQRTRRRDRQSIKQAVHMFVACSRHIRDWTLKEHQISPTKVVIINNGVDEESFRPRDGHLCPRDTLEVLFIGRIDRNKGPDIVADAVAKLRSEGLSINLTVAGGLWFYGHGNEDRDPFFQTCR